MAGEPLEPRRRDLERELLRKLEDLERSPADPEINREVGSVLYQLGRYPEALDHFQKVTAAEPENALAWHHVGYAAFYAGYLDVAEAAFRREIALGRDNAVSRGALASTLRLLQQPQEAIEQGQQALLASPNPSLRQRLHRMIGTWMEERGDVEGALVHLQRAVEANPEDALAQHNLGLAFLWRQQYAAAMAHLRVASRLDRQDAETWALLGEAARLVGALGTARAALEQALALRGDVGQWEAELAWVLDSLGKPEQAIEHGQRALQQPLDAYGRSWTHTILAFAYAGLGNEEAKLHHLEEAARTAPDLASVHYGLGVAYYNRSRPGDALPPLRAATALTPEDVHAWYALGLAAHQAEEYPLAQEALERAIALGQNDIETRQLLLVVLQAQEKWVEVIDCAWRLFQDVRDTARRVWLYCVLADASDRLERSEEALRLLQRGSALQTDDPPAHFNLAGDYHRLGHCEEALAEVRRAVALGPEDLEFQVFLGQLLVEREEDEEAERVLRSLLDGAQRELACLNLVILLTDQGRNQEALELAETHAAADRDSARCWAALSVALRKTGNAEKAAEALEAARRLDPDDPWVASVAAGTAADES